MSKIYLRFNIENSKPISCDYGTAWLMALIGPFYPFIKKDYRMFGIVLLVLLLVNALILITIQLNIAILCCIFITFLTNLLFAFNYNMIVVEHLLKQGYVPVNYDTCNKLLKKGIYFKLK